MTLSYYWRRWSSRTALLEGRDYRGRLYTLHLIYW